MYQFYKASLELISFVSLQVLGEARGQTLLPGVEQCTADKFEKELRHELEYFKKAKSFKFYLSFYDVTFFILNFTNRNNVLLHWHRLFVLVQVFKQELFVQIPSFSSTNHENESCWQESCQLVLDWTQILKVVPIGLSQKWRGSMIFSPCIKILSES